MEKFYILIENDYNVIFISDKKVICQKFKDRYHSLIGDSIKLDIYQVNSENIKLGVKLTHKLFYRFRN